MSDSPTDVDMSREDRPETLLAGLRDVLRNSTR